MTKQDFLRGTKEPRVLAAMSGGVDSSVATAHMVEQGYEVIGVTLKLWEGPDGQPPTSGCCTVSDAEDARRVADRLQIPYYVLDYTTEFHDGVYERFLSEYISGRTPNPCIECNRKVKFSRLLEHARELECQLLVTGHYARTRFQEGSWRLWRGVDPQKDQSYVLSMLGQPELEKVRFPVGEWDKTYTRQQAERWGFRNAHKPDSQDICFVGTGDYRQLIPTGAPGPVVDQSGREVGTHQGVGTVTIGQRRGLGIPGPEPRFVIGIDAEHATVRVGSYQDLAVTEIQVEDVSWVRGHPPGSSKMECQYRAHGEAVPGRWEEPDRFRFHRTQYGVAPGQTASFYCGQDVLGGGVISRTGEEE